MIDDQMVLQAVGRVASSITARERAPRQGSEGAPSAWLLFDGRFERAVADLRVGDDVVVLTWLHEADRGTQEVHPRDDPDAPLTGVFSTRSSDRPNPVGLHDCRIVAVDGQRVEVFPLEAIDGTPVIDVKPVLRRDR